MRAQTTDCDCLVTGPGMANAPSSYLGQDPTKGRYADVETIECSRCPRLWLLYRVEFEWQSRSGRWYAGVVERADLEDLHPPDASTLIEGLPWYLAGGSYFGGKITRCSGPLPGL